MVGYDGHCINGNVPIATSRKNISKGLACQFWKNQEQLIPEQRESVIRAIFKMQKMLEDISLILKDN